MKGAKARKVGQVGQCERKDRQVFTFHSWQTSHIYARTLGSSSEFHQLSYLTLKLIKPFLQCQFGIKRAEQTAVQRKRCEAPTGFRKGP